MDPDVIVIPPATTADVLPPITSELTYALMQNTPTVASAVSQVSYVSQGNVYYTFQHDPSATATQITKATNVTPLSAELVTPPITSQPALVAPEPLMSVTESTNSVPTPPKKKKDDAVFLTPLPIITYAKPPTRITKQYPKPRPTDPNQNQLIKALLAQKSTPGPYVARPSFVRPTTSFIIRASTQTPSGQTQILNLPVSVSTPVSIVRNITQSVPVRPTFTHNLLVKDLARPVSRSAFVRTSTGTDFIPRNSAPAKASTTMIITTPMTVVPQTSIAPIITTTGTGTIVTTTVTSSKAKPYVFTSTPSHKTRTTTYPTYTKTYIPVPQFRKPKPTTTNVPKSLELIGSKALPSCSNTRKPATITMLGPRGFSTTSGPATIRQRPPGARTNIVPGYRNKYLEPGEIPQVRKIPPRTFPGPRSVSAAQRQAAALVQQQASAKLKAAKHASHHEESQATLRALQVHQATSRAVLQATSLAALQAASHAQLEAASQERLKAAQQRAKKQPATKVNTSQSQVQIATLGQLQTVTLAKPQGTLNVQLLTASQAQLLANSKMQLQVTSQAQLQAALQAQSNATSQAQLNATSQAQLSTTSQVHLNAISQSQLHATLQAQLNAKSQAQLNTNSQAQFNTSSQSQLNATFQAQSNSTLHTPLNATSQAQSNVTIQAQLNTTSQAQLQSTLQAQLNNTSQMQLQTSLQAQLNTSSQAQLQATSQGVLQTVSFAPTQANAHTQLQVVSLAQHQARALTQHQSQVMPNPRTHHRLIIRSAPIADRVVTNPVTLQNLADAPVTVPTSLNEQLPNTSQGSVVGAASSIHTTSTLTLSTGTALVMPHYKTTVFKNLSTIGRAEPPRFATPATAERVMIRRPVAYFSARRTFPTQPSASGNPVNVQRHIIRTIPRHVLQNHLGSLQSAAAHAPPGPSTPQVVSTSSSELPGFNTLTQNKQGADKNK